MPIEPEKFGQHADQVRPNMTRKEANDELRKSKKSFLIIPGKDNTFEMVMKPEKKSRLRRNKKNDKPLVFEYSKVPGMNERHINNQILATFQTPENLKRAREASERAIKKEKKEEKRAKKGKSKKSRSPTPPTQGHYAPGNHYDNNRGGIYDRVPDKPKGQQPNYDGTGSPLASESGGTYDRVQDARPQTPPPGDGGNNLYDSVQDIRPPTSPSGNGGNNLYDSVQDVRPPTSPSGNGGNNLYDSVQDVRPPTPPSRTGGQNNYDSVTTPLPKSSSTSRAGYESVRARLNSSRGSMYDSVTDAVAEAANSKMETRRACINAYKEFNSSLDNGDPRQVPDQDILKAVSMNGVQADAELKQSEKGSFFIHEPFSGEGFIVSHKVSDDFVEHTRFTKQDDGTYASSKGQNVQDFLQEVSPKPALTANHGKNLG